MNDTDKHQIINYVYENLEGESTCDDSDECMLVFTFTHDPENQCLIGTDNILELLKMGFFVLYAGNNDSGNFEIAICDCETYRQQ